MYIIGGTTATRPVKFHEALFVTNPASSNEHWAITQKGVIIIPYHFISFRGSVQDYKIHIDMEIVIFA